MSQYSSEGHSWAFKFNFKGVEYTGNAQKMWNNGIPFFATQWKQKDEPGPSLSGALYPHRSAGTVWSCEMPFTQEMINAVGKAIEERVLGAGCDLFST